MLIKIGNCTDALRAAASSSNLERARRAALILETIAQRRDQQLLDNLETFAKRGEIDRFVVAFARLEKGKGPQEDAYWRVLAKLCDHLRELTGRDPTRRPTKPLELRLDFPNLLVDPPPAIEQGIWRIRGHDVTMTAKDSLISSFVVSSGTIRSRSAISTALFSLKPVTLDCLGNSIVVCDGDVTVSQMADSLVIARGKVRIEKGAMDSRIVSLSDIDQAPRSILRRTVVEAKQLQPLGFVRFFEPAHVGVDVSPAKAGVTVKSVAPKELFARSGIRKGDVILRVGGTSVSSVEHFRLRLREALALEQPPMLSVQRGETVLDIPLAAR